MRFCVRIVFICFLAVLAGCAQSVTVEQASSQLNPAMPEQIQPTAMPEKVVQLATMTPTFDLSRGTPTPFREQDGQRPTPTPFSLRDWGVPVTAYSDRTAGFAFECPSDWTVAPPAEDERTNGSYYTIVLRSSYPIESRVNPGEPPRMGVVDITVSNDGTQYTLDEAVQKRKDELGALGQPWKVTAEGSWTLPGGINVVRFDLETPIGPARETVAVVNGRRVLFTGTESLELFNSIAMSLVEE